MLDTFKARLKAKYPGVNLSKERITAIADRLHKKFPDLTEEADHDAKLDELNELTPFDEIAKSDDKIRTLEAKSKGQKTPEELAAEEAARKKADDAKKGDDEPAWFKAYREATDAKLQAFENEKKQGTIKQQLQTKLKDVPASIWSKRAMPESEDAIDAFVTEVQEDYKTDFVDKGLITPAPGGSKGGNTKPTEKEVDALVDKIINI
jgi:hypothetical protein